MPTVYIKPFDSFLEKTFRRNVLDNKNWPEPPGSGQGWLLPPSWHSRINDVVRTIIGAKYLDGVRFTAEKLTALAESLDLHSRVYYEAREEGYYGVHFYVTHSFEVPRMDWATEQITAQVEIQITTQMQEVLRDLTHLYYERRRRTPAAARNEKWQWDYACEEFGPNYLGHILHYAEGMIMEIRSRQTNA